MALVRRAHDHPAEQVFAGLAGQVPVFSGMSYRGLRDAGQVVKA